MVRFQLPPKHETGGPPIVVCPCLRINTRVYPKVSGLAAWNENCKWYSSLPLDFMSQSSEFWRHKLCVASQRVIPKVSVIFRYRLSPETFGYTVYSQLRFITGNRLLYLQPQYVP
jgi:hypothetical protein